MKKGKPIPIEEIPEGNRSSKHQDIYDQVLSLNGEALLVECDDLREALALTGTCRGVGKGRRLGLASRRHGNTVYVYKR